MINFRDLDPDGSGWRRFQKNVAALAVGAALVFMAVGALIYAAITHIHIGFN